MTSITQLVRSNAVVNAKGEPTQRFYDWTQRVTQLQILDGSGSPEGVVRAPVRTLYMDTAGSAGSILYIKRDADVSGDTSEGWILV